MLSNYLKATTRNLRKNIIFSLINTFGLSIALAASFLIILFVVNELSYNNSHKNKDSIYRVNSYYKSYKSYNSKTPYIMASILKEEIPQVEKAISTRNLRSFQIKLGEENIMIANPVATNSEVFDIFTIPLLIGSNTGKLLDDKQSICISESIAIKLFSHINVIGEQINVSFDQKEETFNIVAVFKDLPQNSTLQADCFINGWHSLAFINAIFKSNNADTDWSKDFWTTWVKVSPDCKEELITPLLRNLEKKYLSENHKSYYNFQSLSGMYLNSENINSNDKKGDWKTIKIFLAIAILILLVAIINYIILSTAVSSKRAKEIGIRKTFGAKLIR